MRPTCNEIDLAALRYNLQQIRSLLPPGTELLSIIKANAYGHGAGPVCRELEKCGEKYFGVATVGEALKLRNQGVSSEILILSSFYESDIDDIFWHNLTPVCYREDHITGLDASASSAQTVLKIHVKFDTGMGRLGFEWKDARRIASLLLKHRNLIVEGLMSHLAFAEKDTEFNALQIHRFEEIRKAFLEKGINPRFHHIANSSGIIRRLGPSCNLFRPGIALYGCYTDPALQKTLPLKQLMNLRSKIAQIKELEPGRGVSYGHTFITKRNTRVAVIPIGYADGYDRRLSNRGKVLVRGYHAPVVGAVCMDMLLIDITDIKGVKIGDTVTLTGYDSGGSITIGDLASITGTLPYEIMCGISERVVKKHINASVLTHGDGDREIFPHKTP